MYLMIPLALSVPLIVAFERLQVRDGGKKLAASPRTDEPGVGPPDASNRYARRFAGAAVARLRGRLQAFCGLRRARIR